MAELVTLYLAGKGSENLPNSIVFGWLSSTCKTTNCWHFCNKNLLAVGFSGFAAAPQRNS